MPRAPDPDKIASLEGEIQALHDRLSAAKGELLAERFADMSPRFAVGDIVLAPRTLFGKRKLWPAQIVRVDLNYSSGADARGNPWVNRTIGYGFLWQQKDGSFTGTSDAAYESALEET